MRLSRCNAGRYHNWLIYRPPKAAHITISYSFRTVDGSGELLDSWFSQVPIVPYFYPARILETGTNLFWGRFRDDPTNNERPIFGQIAVRTTSVSVSSAKDKFEEYASKLLQNFRLLIGDFYIFRAVENQPSQPEVS